MTPDFWHFAERIIALDTSIARGNAAMEPLFRALVAPLAPRIEVQGVEFRGNTHVNLLASWGPSGAGGLLLVTHSDTVPPGPPEAWTRGPAHRLTRVRSDDGAEQVVGLGVADVKLDLVCKAFALRKLDLTRLKRPLHLLATYGEEVGLEGARHAVATGLVRPEWALCGEPSELVPCHAHKGYAVVKVTLHAPKQPAAKRAGCYRVRARGKAAHSSTPHLGVNAIERLLAALQGAAGAEVLTLSGGSSSNTVPALAEAIVAADRAPAGGEGVEIEACAPDAAADAPSLAPLLAPLAALWREWTALSQALTPREDPLFTPATVVNNFGVAASEGGRLSAVFDARLLPAHDPQDLAKPFQARAAALAEAQGVVLEVVVERDNPGMRSAPDSVLLSALSGALAARGLPSAPRAKPTSTEAGVFHRAGAAAAVFGPGVSTGNAHTANEWNRVSDLAMAIEIYADLVERLCL